MALTCGLIGLPTVGKTTFYNLLTRAGVETSGFMTGKASANVGMATIPDPRIDFLVDIFHPRKTAYAQLQVIDVPGLVPGSSGIKGTGNEFLNAVRDVDALIHILRVFENPQVIHVDGAVDIIRDLETVNLELLLADLELVEKRIERIQNAKKKQKEQEIELVALKKCREALEAEKYIHQLDLLPEEREVLRNIIFLTEKPLLLALNVDEDQMAAGSFPRKDDIIAYGREHQIPLVEICAKVEAEIAQLGDEDRQLFMEEMGITEPGIQRLARAVYQHLGLISFFTVGEDEVKAWTINGGLDARRAAGKIHSDIERGFIRAEVVAYEHFRELGSMARVKEKGLTRLEGKDYIVRDGDIINFRFNV
ncbi:MAG: redox-regulated ATPase YchF [Bacillota bacterium]